MRVKGRKTLSRSESDCYVIFYVNSCQRILVALEHIGLDPKDGDLCLGWVKPGETLVEARSDTDVQIVRQIWV